MTNWDKWLSELSIDKVQEFFRWGVKRHYCEGCPATDLCDYSDDDCSTVFEHWANKECS
jgi:hypothetical protein